MSNESRMNATHDRTNKHFRPCSTRTLPPLVVRVILVFFRIIRGGSGRECVVWGGRQRSRRRGHADHAPGVSGGRGGPNPTHHSRRRRQPHRKPRGRGRRDKFQTTDRERSEGRPPIQLRRRQLRRQRLFHDVLGRHLAPDLPVLKCAMFHRRRSESACHNA